MKTTSLIPWRWKTDEDKGFIDLQLAMNDLLENFWQAPVMSVAPPIAGNGRNNWNPRLDVSETEKEYFVTVELPGLEEKDVNVSLAGDQLVISGEKRAEKDEKNKTFRRVERTWGSFRRVLPLYGEVEAANVKATFNKGVLTVILPKSAKAQELVRAIPVKAG